MNNPLVSIIIPIYNREQTLERCLCSIIRQTYPNLEIIAVDDGGMDHNRVVLERYERRFPSACSLQKNSGVSESRNLGLQMAKGDFVQFVDADDWLTRDATSLLLQAMEPDTQLVISDYYRLPGRRIWIKGHIPHPAP